MMIQNVIYPEEIWDMRQCIRRNKVIKQWYYMKNSNHTSRIYKFNYLNMKCIYLFMIIIYCCCVIITATPGLTDSPSEFLVKTIQNFSTNSNNSNYNNNRYAGSSYNNNNNSSTSAAVKNFVDKSSTSIQTRKILEASNKPADDEEYIEDEDDDYEQLISNKSAKGMYIGAPCEVACNPKLHHVFCDPSSFTCGCEKRYPVIIGLTKGCAKPKKLGEQCFYHQTCIYNDVNSLCVQVSHNALCTCADGFHSVSYSKPTKRVFCTQDIAVLTSDLPTLLGVTTGIAVLAGLICMVLHLFSKTKYPRHRNFADANIPPPIMYSSDTGIPLTVQSGRPSSRSSLRSSGSIGSYGNRRPSSAPQTGSKGVLVSTSRTGAARSAAILLISCHISALSKDNQSESGSCDSMTKHLQKQLQQQRQLLHLELPSAKANNKIRTMLGMNGIDKSDDDLNSLDNESTQIGAVPTPASETARFALPDEMTNRLLHLPIKTNRSKSVSCDMAQFFKILPQDIVRGGSRRPSLASIHSTSSSVRSYSMIRFEKEIQQKEIRQEMKLRLARLQQHQQFGQNKPQIIVGDINSHGAIGKVLLPTPSPLTPNSTDELLPSVDETQEIFAPKLSGSDDVFCAAYKGPCSSSSEGL